MGRSKGSHKALHPETDRIYGTGEGQQRGIRRVLSKAREPRNTARSPGRARELRGDSHRGLRLQRNEFTHIRQDVLRKVAQDNEGARATARPGSVHARRPERTQIHDSLQDPGRGIPPARSDYRGPHI